MKQNNEFLIIAIFVMVMISLVCIVLFNPNPVEVTVDGNHLTIEGGCRAWVSGQSYSYQDSICLELEPGEYSITVFDSNDKVIHGSVVTIL